MKIQIMIKMKVKEAKRYVVTSKIHLFVLRKMNNHRKYTLYFAVKKRELLFGELTRRTHRIHIERWKR